MEQKEKVSMLIIGYDEVKDYRQLKIAILKSFNLNLVNKIYFLDKNSFAQQIEKFCEEFKIECEKLIPLPAKLSNEQTEKLSSVKCLVVIDNGEDKRFKKYETFVKSLSVNINTWKTKDGNLLLK